MWVPVIEVPTIRTVGVIEPTLNRELVQNSSLMYRNNLVPNIIISQYEDLMKDYRKASTTIAQTTETTKLVGQPICQEHRDCYNLMEWIKPTDWRHLQEAAKAHGFEIPAGVNITVTFKPLGWTPGLSHLEIER